MEKKGLLHIDWIVSFGIFVIFLLLIFIYFGPALTQEYSDEYLKSIAQKGFKDATFREVIFYPVYVETHSPGTFSVQLPDELTSIPIRKLPLVHNFSEIIYTRENVGGVLNFDYPNINLTGVDTFYIGYAEDFNLTTLPVSNNYVDANTTLGVKTRHYAFSEKLFLNLTSLDYDQFKEALKYPKTKDISVSVYLKNSTNLVYEYDKVSPQENDNVFVISWFDAWLNETLSYRRVYLSIQTW